MCEGLVLFWKRELMITVTSESGLIQNANVMHKNHKLPPPYTCHDITPCAFPFPP